MKILLAATSIEDFSGASKCLVELASALISSGQDVTISIPKADGPIEAVLHKKNIPFVIMREYQCWYKEKFEHQFFFLILLKRIMNNFSIIKCRRYLRKEKFDIVHVNALTAYVVGKAALQEKVPVVWHIREFMEEDLGISFINKRWSLSILNQASCFIAISEQICNKWKKIIKAPIKVVYDGVPVEKYYVEKKKTEEPLNVLLYGRINKGKGQLFFVQAAQMVLKKCCIPCRFYFAGEIEDQSYFEQCVKLIKKHSLENSIKYIGKLDDVKSLLAKTDIVCVCSTREGFGRVTVEAMLGNCLVIGAGSGATKELIKDGVNGILYKPDDINDFSSKLLVSLNNYKSYAKIIEEGQRFAYSHFTDEKNMKEIFSIYKEIV